MSHDSLNRVIQSMSCISSAEQGVTVTANGETKRLGWTSSGFLGLMRKPVCAKGLSGSITVKCPDNRGRWEAQKTFNVDSDKSYSVACGIGKSEKRGRTTKATGDVMLNPFPCPCK